MLYAVKVWFVIKYLRFPSTIPICGCGVNKGATYRLWKKVSRNLRKQWIQTQFVCTFCLCLFASGNDLAYGDNNGNGIKQSGAMKQLKRQLSGKLSNVQKLTPNIGMYPMLLYYITNLTVNTSTTEISL